MSVACVEVRIEVIYTNVYYQYQLLNNPYYYAGNIDS